MWVVFVSHQITLPALDTIKTAPQEMAEDGPVKSSTPNLVLGWHKVGLTQDKCNLNLTWLAIPLPKGE